MCSFYLQIFVVSHGTGKVPLGEAEDNIIEAEGDFQEGWMVICCIF